MSYIPYTHSLKAILYDIYLKQNKTKTFLSWKGKTAERDRQRFFHLLLNPPKTTNGWGRSKVKPGAQNYIRLPTGQQRPKYLGSVAFSGAYQGAGLEAK